MTTTTPLQLAMVDYAQQYVDLGWYIFPAWWVNDDGSCGCGDRNCKDIGKHPIGDCVHRGVWDASNDFKRVTAWWRGQPKANIGLHPGPSGLIAIDLDKYKDEFDATATGEIITKADEETLTSLTGGGGNHLVYALPSGEKFGSNRGSLPPGIDIRCWGGYIILSPSNHKSGNRYQWETGYGPEEMTPAPLPQKLHDILKAAQQTAQAAKVAIKANLPDPDVDQWHLPEWLIDDLNNGQDASDRSTNDYRVLCALAERGLSDDDITAVWQHYPIGTDGKYADDGDRYLSMTLGKVRAKVGYPVGQYNGYQNGVKVGGNLGGVDDMVIQPNGTQQIGADLAADVAAAGATVHTNGHSSATAQQQTTTQAPGAAPAGGKVPPIVALLKTIDDAGNDAKSKMVAGKMPPAVRAALDAKIKALSKEIATNAAHAVLIADAIQRAGGYPFDDALLFVQECILSAQMGKERAKGFAAIKVKVDKLRNMGHKFRLNLMEDNVEMDGQTVADVGKSELALYMAAHGIKKTEMEDCLNVLASEDTYHPIKDYLNGLVWDGKNHFGEMTRHLTGDGRYIDYKAGRLVKLGDTRDDANGIVTAADVTDTVRYLPLHHVIIYRWMLGCVARALEGDKQTAFKFQTPVLVFVGGQGLGKSAWVRYLVSGVGFDYHRESPLDPHHPEHVRSAVTKWIWEVSELGSSLRRTDRDAMKGFITQEWHTYRKPWGRGQITKPTLANFVGTVNSETGFLDDPTGNRRYLPLHITHIDHGYKNAIDINQVWAQIMHLYKSGQTPSLTAVESAAMGETLEEHEVENPLQGHIQRLFVVDPSNDGTFTFTSDIIHALKQDGIALNANAKWAGREVNEALAPLGVVRDKRSVGGVKGWGWVGVSHRMRIP